MQASRTCVSMTAALVIVAASTFADQLGDPAQELQIAAWVKGEPVVLKDGKGKHVYVIEFWQTVCPYSRASVPRLTEMQKKYMDKGVVFVGVSTEEVDVVKAFVEKQGPAMDYRVAVDKDSASDAQYRGRFLVNLLPYAFVIDKSGKVVWHGHPMMGLGKTLDAILAGTYDIEARRRTEKVHALIPEYFRMVRSASRAGKAGPLGEKIVTEGASDAMLMNMLAWGIVAEPGLIKRDLDLALRAAQAAYDASEGKYAGIVDTYARVLFDRGAKKEAVEYQQKAVELVTEDGQRKELEKTLNKYRKAVSGD